MSISFSASLHSCCCLLTRIAILVTYLPLPFLSFFLFFFKSSQLIWRVILVILALGSRGREDQEFKSILIYIVSSKPTEIIWDLAWNKTQTCSHFVAQVGFKLALAFQAFWLQLWATTPYIFMFFFFKIYFLSVCMFVCTPVYTHVHVGMQVH